MNKKSLCCIPVKFFKYSLILLLLFCFTSAARAYELVDRQQKEFPFQAGQQLIVQLQTGHVVIHPWKKNKILIKIKRWVEAPSKNRAEERLSDLNLDFLTDENRFEIRQLDQLRKNPLSNLLKATGLMKRIKSRVDLNILVPENTNLTVLQRAGKVSVDSISGNLRIELRRGAVKLNRISSDKMDFRLGKVQALVLYVGGQGGGDSNIAVEIDDGRFVLKECRANRLIIRSKRATVFVLNNQLDECDVTTEKGDIFLLPRLNTFEELKLQSKKGSVYLRLPEKPDCILQAETALGNIFCPYDWPVRKRGSGYLLFLRGSTEETGRIDVITEIGDVIIQPMR